MDYQSNSYKHKNELKKEEHKIEKVVTGTVKTKKKSEVRKIADNIISDDASKVKEYVVMDVLIPALKKAVSDIITNGIDIILYGEAGHSKKAKGTISGVSYNRNYNSMSNGYKTDYRQTRSYSFNEITLDNRGEAELVLTNLDEIIGTYGFATVSDLNELVGVTGSYTDNNYGWSDIRSAQVVRVREGYLLKLPKALPID